LLENGLILCYPLDKKRKIIGCVLSRLHKHLLKLEKCICPNEVYCLQNPKNHYNFGFLNWLDKVQKEQFDIIILMKIAGF